MREKRDERERRDEQNEASSEFCVLSSELKTGETGEKSAKRAAVRISENSELRTQNPERHIPHSRA